MTNIIELKNYCDRVRGYFLLKEELAKSAAAKPIFAAGYQATLQHLTQLFTQLGLKHFHIYDLFYINCIYIGTIFSKVPAHYKARKNGDHLMESLMIGLHEILKLEDEWWHAVFIGQASMENSPQQSWREERVMNLLHFFQTCELDLTLLFEKDRKPEESEIFFSPLDFSLRRELSKMMQPILLQIETVYSKDLEMGLLQDTMCWTYTIAAMIVRYFKISAESFMKVGMGKLGQMVGN